jgi:hypothetical protein
LYDEEERRVGLLLLGNAAVLAHGLDRPLAAEMDESEERCEDTAYPERGCRVEGDAIAGSDTAAEAGERRVGVPYRRQIVRHRQAGELPGRGVSADPDSRTYSSGRAVVGLGPTAARGRKQQ